MVGIFLQRSVLCLAHRIALVFGIGFIFVIFSVSVLLVFNLLKRVCCVVLGVCNVGCACMRVCRHGREKEKE